MTVKSILLSDIGSISSGPNFYKKKLYEPQEIDNNKSYALYVKTTKKDFYTKDVESRYVEITRKNKHHLLQEGDVIINIGSNKINFALAYNNSMGDIILSHTYKIMYTNISIVNPEYLAYYLNKYIFKIKNSNNIDVEDIKIDLPTLEKQNMIVSIINDYNNKIDDLYKKQYNEINEIINQNKYE
jgi:restriction endonuclease S subunit